MYNRIVISGVATCGDTRGGKSRCHSKFSYFSPKNSHFRGAGKLITKKKDLHLFRVLFPVNQRWGHFKMVSPVAARPLLRVQARSQKPCTRKANDKLGGAIMDVIKLREHDT